MRFFILIHDRIFHIYRIERFIGRIVRFIFTAGRNYGDCKTYRRLERFAWSFDNDYVRHTFVRLIDTDT